MKCKRGLATPLPNHCILNRPMRRWILHLFRKCFISPILIHVDVGFSGYDCCCRCCHHSSDCYCCDDYGRCEYHRHLTYVTGISPSSISSSPSSCVSLFALSPTDLRSPETWSTSSSFFPYFFLCTPEGHSHYKSVYLWVS